MRPLRTKKMAINIEWAIAMVVRFLPRWETNLAYWAQKKLFLLFFADFGDALDVICVAYHRRKPFLLEDVVNRFSVWADTLHCGYLATIRLEQRKHLAHLVYECAKLPNLCLAPDSQTGDKELLMHNNTRATLEIYFVIHKVLSLW